MHLLISNMYQHSEIFGKQITHLRQMRISKKETKKALLKQKRKVKKRMKTKTNLQKIFIFKQLNNI